MSSRFASAIAFSADWREAVEEVLAQLEGPLAPQANLGFLYIADQYAHAARDILARLRAETGIDNWVGSTGVGVIGRAQAQIDSPGLSVLIGQMPEDSYRVFSGRAPLSRDFAAYGAVVHADPATPDMSELVQDMATKIRAGTLAGGLASARGTAWQFAGDEPLTGGMSGVAFDSRVRVLTAMSQGYAPQPGSWRVTAAHDHIIEKIDGRPALDVYREAAGPLLGADLRRATRSLLVGLASSSEDRRHYAVRSVVGIDLQKGALAINDGIEAGQHLVFVRRDEHSARDDLRRMLQELREACPGVPAAGLYISCAGRGGAMFERDDSEVEMIGQAFGNLPIAGFFAGGEIVGNRLYGFTGALTLFF